MGRHQRLPGSYMLTWHHLHGWYDAAADASGAVTEVLSCDTGGG